MNKIAIITDSAADLSKDIIEKYNIIVLPFRVICKDKEYIDGVDITPEEIYERLDTDMPSTSLPLLIDMENAYKKIISEGYTHAICITLSSGLSGIHNALSLASKEFPEIESFVYDSRGISMYEGLLAIRCAEMAEKGMSFDEIVKQLPIIRDSFKVYFVIGTLKYLKRGGRIGKISGTVGELLNLKPIVFIDDDGKYVTHSKTRGRKQSLRKMEEIAAASGELVDIYLAHGNAKEETLEMAENLKKYKSIRNVYFVGNISPVSGVHSGPGLVGVICEKIK